MDLNNAEVCVTTQQCLDLKNDDYCWFTLSDYNDVTEFNAACSEYFSDEKNPVFKYSEWTDIPDSFINSDWLCPNIFELLDALEQLEVEDQKCFINWCQQYQYDLTSDSPYLLITRFQDNFSRVTLSNPEDIAEETLILRDINRSYSDAGLIPASVFGDDYN